MENQHRLVKWGYWIIQGFKQACDDYPHVTVNREPSPPHSNDDVRTYLSYGKSFIIQFSVLYETIERRTRNRIKVPTHNNRVEAAIFLMGNTGNLCQKHCQLGQLNVTSPWVIQQMCVSYTDCRRGTTWDFGLQE